MYHIRQILPQDRKQILSLYKTVASLPGGIAMGYDEITETYVEHFIQQASNTGVQIVAVENKNPENIIGEIHCYKLLPKVFRHVLSDLTIVVNPQFQGNGIGKNLFSELLHYISTNRLDVLRVELITRETNTKAITFYKNLGFVVEGRFEKRIDGSGEFEADIPMAWFNKNFVPDGKR